MVVVDAALAGEVEGNRASLHLHVAVVHGGQAVGAVFARVLLVANADEGRFKQADDGRENLFARQAGQRKVVLDALADDGKRLAELDHALVLGLVADLAPPRVVPALLASTLVASGSLQVAVGVGADPDLAPGRRDDERADASKKLNVVDLLAIGREVAEAAPDALPCDAGLGSGHVTKTGGLRAGDRIGDCDRGLFLVRLLWHGHVGVHC